MPSDAFIDASDPSRQGYYRRANGSLSALTPQYTRNDLIPHRWHIMEESVATAIERLRHRDIAGATLKVAIGQPDLGPSGGTFLLSYAGNSTGLTVLAYDITAAALETALNANGGVSGVGGVDVTGGPYQFVIKFRTVGDKAQFVADAANLEPASVISVQTTEDGTAGTHEEQVIRLLQRPYAYSDGYTVESDPSTATPTLTSAGSATTKGVIDIALPETAESGSFRPEFSRAQVWRITATANTLGAVQKELLTIVQPTSAGGFNNLTFDTEDKNGIVRVWFDYNSTGTAPAIPAGGRLLEIDYVTATAAAIATAIKTAFHADSEFNASITDSVGNKVLIDNVAFGTRVWPTVAISVDSGSITFAESITGDAGRLAGDHFPLADNNGTVAIWFQVDGSAEPDHDANRSIVVDASTFTTAAIAATAIAAAIDADSEFTATASGATVTVTDVNAGTRSTGDVQNTAGLGIGIVTKGANIVGEFPHDVTAVELELFFAEFFKVTATNPRQFRFVAIDKGTWSNPTVASNFVVPTYFDGTISLATTTLLAAFAATTDETLDAVLEVEYTAAGAVETILRMPVVIHRDVLDQATIGPTEVQSWLVDGDAIGLPDGSLGSLALFFTDDPDNGIYRISANRWAIVAGGAVVGDFNTTYVSLSDVPLRIGDGTAVAPALAFSSDTNTGFHWISDGVFGITANGVLLARVSTVTGITLARGGIGYETGAGGTVTQATSKSTGVTLNKVTGEITMHNAALAADAFVSFILTNSTIAAGDWVDVKPVSGGDISAYFCNAAASGGSATIYVRNVTTGGLSEAIVLKFVLFKAVTT